jgi:DNA-binding HxlR family transcriptional regulator
MSEGKDLREEMKRLQEEMQALKQQLRDMATQTSDLEHKRRGIHIDVNDHLTGLSDYLADVMEGVNEGIRGELEKSIFIHPRRGEVIIHRNHEHHRPQEHIEKPDLNKAASIMSALGQEHRLKILSELMTGGKYISDFQTGLPEITASTLSSHLDVLQEAGLVVQERVRGRYLITIPGRIAYKMAAAVARQRETSHDFGYTYRTRHEEDEEKENENDHSENEKEE